MSPAGRDDRNLTDLDELIGKITVDADGDDETLWAFRQAFEEDVTLLADGFVIGEPVSVTEVDYDGHERRGLTARCRREDGAEHVVAACGVLFPPGSSGARHVAAYRKWLGLDPHPAETDRAITLRASRLWDVVPGEIVTVKPRKQWSYAGHPYLSGEVEGSRLDARALGLVPLRLEAMGTWDPKEHYWGEESEPVEEWAKPIIARGPRPDFEMEQVLPGADPDDPFADPITESNDLKDAGDGAEAHRILMVKVCEGSRWT